MAGSADNLIAAPGHAAFYDVFAAGVFLKGASGQAGKDPDADGFGQIVAVVVPDDRGRPGDRAACGTVCPPQGLYLAEVTYPQDPFAKASS